MTSVPFLKPTVEGKNEPLRVGLWSPHMCWGIRGYTLTHIPQLPSPSPPPHFVFFFYLNGINARNDGSCMLQSKYPECWGRRIAVSSGQSWLQSETPSQKQKWIGIVWILMYCANYNSRQGLSNRKFGFPARHSWVSYTRCSDLPKDDGL